MQHDIQAVFYLESLFLVKSPLQFFPDDKFHGDERHVFVFPVLINRDNIGVGQPPGRLCLTAKPAKCFLSLGLVNHGLLDGLDGNGALYEWIKPFIDNSHSPAPKFALDLVFAEFR